MTGRARVERRRAACSAAVRGHNGGAAADPGPVARRGARVWQEAQTSIQRTRRGVGLGHEQVEFPVPRQRQRLHRRRRADPRQAFVLPVGVGNRECEQRPVVPDRHHRCAHGLPRFLQQHRCRRDPLAVLAVERVGDHGDGVVLRLALVVDGPEVRGVEEPAQGGGVGPNHRAQSRAFDRRHRVERAAQVQPRCRSRHWSSPVPSSRLTRWYLTMPCGYRLFSWATRKPSER